MTLQEANDRKAKDFINERYGIGDLDHESALCSGHIYDLMHEYAKQAREKAIDDVLQFLEDENNTHEYRSWGCSIWCGSEECNGYCFNGGSENELSLEKVKKGLLNLKEKK